MSGSCVGLSSSFFRASESNVRHFFDGWFWLVGLESCWGFPVSDACWTVPLGAPKFNPSEAEAVSPWPSSAWFSLVFVAISPLPVRWCQAVALAFLHLSLGRQKATSGSFSTDGFGGLGLNPAGVSLFRMHVERCPSGPKFNPSEAEAVSPWPSTAWFSLGFF